VPPGAAYAAHVSRRTLTLLLASLLAMVLTSGAVSAQVPYVALGPGPTYNTLGEVEGADVIQIQGSETFPTDGRLDLTTVGVTPSLTLLEALRGWFDRDLAVVPRDVVYPPGRRDEEVNAENAESMRRSQNSAATAAARYLGYEVAEVTIEGLSPGSPAQGRLQVGDVLTRVDDTPLRDAAELRSLVDEGGVGTVRRIDYLRDGVAGTASVTTTGAEDDEGQTRPVLGVLVAEEPVDLPFDVEITLEEVGGPSAGLMFALGILEKLGEPSLTGGRYIAGTGEISGDGMVGPIGGIPQKLVAASDKGADVFLVPAGNCAEAVLRPPDGLVLAEVGALDEALAALEAVRTGEQPELCPT